MKKNDKKIKLVTHNGPFHADDVFACASLILLMEKRKKLFKIIRTRDKKIIESGDFVFDVGGIYDSRKNRFDHHQASFKENRKNGIRYSSFGLVWQKYGKEICGTDEIKNRMDRMLVEQVDATDNGMSIFKPLTSHVLNYDISSVIGSFSPGWKEENLPKYFNKAVKFAKHVLQKEINQFHSVAEVSKEIQKKYKQSGSGKLLVLDTQIPRYLVDTASRDYKKLLFIVFQGSHGWKILAVRKKPGAFGNKKNLPKAWAGLEGKALQKVTGVHDAVFCHRGLFLAGAGSKAGILKMAELALKK